MKRLFNNTLVTSVDYAVLIVLNLIATPFLIAHFGVTGYGAFVFLSIFSIYGALMFFDLGMEGSLMNYVARFDATNDHERVQDSLSIAVVFYGAIGVVLAIGLHFGAGFIARQMLHETDELKLSMVVNSIDIVCLNIALQFLTIPFTAILQGMGRFVITKSLSVFMNILRYTLIIVAAVLYGRIDIAFMIITGLTVVRLSVLVAIFVFGLPQFRGFRVRFSLDLMKTLMSYSSTLFISRLIGLLWNQSGKILIWLYLAVSSMTVYDVVMRPAMLLRVILGVVTSALIPEVARFHEQNDVQSISKLYTRLLRYSYMMLLPAVVVLYVYMDKLLGLWVGEEFAQYGYMACIVLTVNVILPIPSIASTMVVGLEQVKQTIWIPITATTINIGLSIVLLKTMGLAGLFIATLVAQAFAVVPYFVVMRRIVQLTSMAVLAPVFRIAGIACLFVLPHLGGRFAFEGSIVSMAVISLCTLAAHYFVYYRYGLQKNERAFVAERLRLTRPQFVEPPIDSGAPFVGRQE